MPFRPPKKNPQFADLKGILSQSKQTDNALYQTVEAIIERLTQFQQVTVEQIESGPTNLTNILKNVANKNATYHTKLDETTNLPNSVQLLAGSGVEFDDTVANKRTIKLSGDRSHYDSPLTDGHIDETELIFANGECIIVQVPII